MRLSVGALLVSFVSAAPAFAQVRPTFPIVYISIQKILAEADDAKAGAKELETLRNTRAQELNAKKQALDATKLQIANAGGIFSTSKRQQLTELAKRQEADLQHATQQAQTDFVELQKKIQERLRSEVSRIVTSLATQRGVAYVLNQDNAVVLAPAGADWTGEVLARLNGGNSQGSTGDKAGPEKSPAGKQPARTP